MPSSFGGSVTVSCASAGRNRVAAFGATDDEFKLCHLSAAAEDGHKKLQRATVDVRFEQAQAGKGQVRVGGDARNHGGRDAATVWARTTA